MALGPRITMILVVRDDAVNVQVEGDAPPCFGLLRLDALLVVMGVGGPEDVRKISLRLCGAPPTLALLRDGASCRLRSRGCGPLRRRREHGRPPRSSVSRRRSIHSPPGLIGKIPGRARRAAPAKCFLSTNITRCGLVTTTSYPRLTRSLLEAAPVRARRSAAARPGRRREPTRHRAAERRGPS